MDSEMSPYSGYRAALVVEAGRFLDVALDQTASRLCVTPIDVGRHGGAVDSQWQPRRLPGDWS